jgi:hypothetical protein
VTFVRITVVEVVTVAESVLVVIGALWDQLHIQFGWTSKSRDAMRCERKSNNDGGKKGRFDRDFKKFLMMELLFYRDANETVVDAFVNASNFDRTRFYCGVEVVLERQIRRRTLRAQLAEEPWASCKSGTDVLTQFSWNTVLSCNVYILFIS